MSRKRSMTKSDWNRRKKEILAWKVPKNAEKKVFTDGVIVNIYDTAGRLLWRYERYWNVIGRFAEGDYRYSKRFTYDEKGNLIRLTEKQTPPHKTPSMMITDFEMMKPVGCPVSRKNIPKETLHLFMMGKYWRWNLFRKQRLWICHPNFISYGNRICHQSERLHMATEKAFVVIWSLKKKMAPKSVII